MRFEDALKSMREGKKVRLTDYYIRYYIVNGSIWEETIIDSSGHVYDAGGIADLSCHKILSEDWEVVND